jgi:tRNA(adenine34) deaminase
MGDSEAVTDATAAGYMRAAIEQALLGEAAGEVPIGAVVVLDGVVVARAFNQPISSVDPTAHAEIVALREAARVLGNYRLTEATVYVTIEPCLMCVGALVHARVREVVYGAVEPKTGALLSTVHALDTPGLNHRFAVLGGLLENECRALVQEFFRRRRRSAPGDGPPSIDRELADQQSRSV